MVVRDEDLNDILAWFSSFYGQLVPLTQWCRLWTTNEIQLLKSARENPSLDSLLGAWIGTILAECQAQTSQTLNFKELTGAAPLTSASYAIGRATAVWGGSFPLMQVVNRYDDLSSKIRENSRRLSALNITPILSGLIGEAWTGEKSLKQIFLPLQYALHFLTINPGDEAAFLGVLVGDLAKELKLPELRACMIGPQYERLKAFDQLARTLKAGPRSPAIDSILGFGASLLEPGVAIFPDLMRPHLADFPTSSIWLGTFAGIWSPDRVLNDFDGLGRLIAKSLLSPNDLFSKPACDIAFTELERWLGTSSNSGKIPVRGMAQRSLNVELFPGVSCGFGIGRNDAQTADSTNSSKGNYTSDINLRKEPDRFYSLIARVEQLEKEVVSQKRAVEQLTQDFSKAQEVVETKNQLSLIEIPPLTNLDKLPIKPKTRYSRKPETKNED